MPRLIFPDIFLGNQEITVPLAHLICRKENFFTHILPFFYSCLPDHPCYLYMQERKFFYTHSAIFLFLPPNPVIPDHPCYLYMQEKEFFYTHSAIFFIPASICLSSMPKSGHPRHFFGNQGSTDTLANLICRKENFFTHILPFFLFLPPFACHQCPNPVIPDIIFGADIFAAVKCQTGQRPAGPTYF